MSTKRLPSLSEALVALGCLLLPASAHAQSAGDAPLRATYPQLASAPSAAVYAGVALDRVTLPGLHLRSRDDQTLESGGVTLAFADDQENVQTTVQVAVAPDAAGARSFALGYLRGVSGVLDPSAADEIAYADGSDRTLVAVHGNVAYVVSGPKATSAAAIVKRAITAGAPSFPVVRVALPTSFEGSAPIGVTTSGGAKYRLRATGAYVARGSDRTSVRAFGPGPVTVIATASDALGRVSEARATAVAR